MMSSTAIYQSGPDNGSRWRLSQVSYSSSYYSEDGLISSASSFVDAPQTPTSSDINKGRKSPEILLDANYYSPISSSSANSFIGKPAPTLFEEHPAKRVTTTIKVRPAVTLFPLATPTQSRTPSPVPPPPPPKPPRSAKPAAATKPRVVSAGAISRQSLRTLSPEELRKELGYLPFEYWKGPKKVLPAAQRKLYAHLDEPKRPSTSRRLAAVGVALAQPILDFTAQQQQRKRQQHQARSQVRGEHSHQAAALPSSREKNINRNRDTVWIPQMPASTFQIRDNRGEVELVSGPPPIYQELPPRPDKMRSQPWWNPRYWAKRTWFIVAAVLVVIIVAATVSGVLVAKANRYPNYTKLNYSLKDIYSGESFFENFNYFEGYDPAEGFVHYVPEETATSLNLTYASSKSAFLRVDTSVGPSSTPDASTGRFSVRVSSKTQYENGLFIFDIKHTPYGCGTWPALWLVDENNWPTNGEMDIMEAVNNATDGNQMTLHTTAKCDMSVKRLMTGSSVQSDCHNTTNDNAGCGVKGTTSSYGRDFNAAGGGYMALEWRDEGIRMWQFARSNIPSDIVNRKPDPSSWGTATADFPNTDCSISSHFKNQSIIANIDLCGQWAGNVYDESGCPSNCTDHVANNPSAFENAYWEFGSWEVYQAS